VPQPTRNVPYDIGVVFAIGAGDADADRLGMDVPVRQHVIYEPAKDTLDAKLTDRLQVGAGTPRFGDDGAVLVGQLTDSLRSTRIDPENMHGRRLKYGTFRYPQMSGCVSRVRPRWRSARFLSAALIGLIGFALAGVMGIAAQASADAPIRGYWVARTQLESPEAIRRALTAVQAGAFNAVFVPLPLSAADPLPGFDGAREFIKDARERGIRVHAWIDVNRVSLGDEIPSSSNHLVYQHPEWLMVPRALAPEMLALDPRGPAYLGRLSRWTRTNRTRVDGLYLSPLDPDAVSYVAAAVGATVQRYSVDAVYLDAVRFPGNDFDYSRHALDLFRGVARARLTIADRARVDEIEAVDPFGYPSELPDEWNAFRQGRLTALLSKLRASIKVSNPRLTVTANIAVDDATAREQQFQDWRVWIAERLIDGIGRLNGTATQILLAPDGLLPDPSALPAVQSSASGGSR